MPGARRDLAEYVKRVMKLKRLTQKDVQRMSGGRITDGYVASIAVGRARNPSVDKIKALADGLGVDVNDLFHIACGLPQEPKARRRNNRPSDALMILDTIRQAVVSPDVTQILYEVVRLSPQEKASLLGFIMRFGETTRKAQKTRPD